VAKTMYAHVSKCKNDKINGEERKEFYLYEKMDSKKI
jgi:hypothetical protein